MLRRVRLHVNQIVDGAEDLMRHGPAETAVAAPKLYSAGVSHTDLYGGRTRRGG